MKNIKIFSTSILVFFVALCSLSAQTPAQNKETARKIMAAVDAGDINTFASYLGPNPQEHMPPPPNAPKGISGLELTKMLISGYHKAFPDSKTAIISMVAEGDLVSVFSHFTATNTGDFMGMPATNKKVSVDQVDIIRFDAAGKAVEHWAVMDQLALLQQLGIIPQN